MNAHLRDGAVPALEKLGECLQAIEAAAVQRVGFDVPAASFRRRRFPGGVVGGTAMGRPMRGERGVHLADVRVVQAGAHQRGFEIVVADNLWNSLPPDERVLVGAQKPVALLGPQWLYPGSLSRASAFACAIFSRSSGASSRWSNQSSARRLSANG